MSNTYLGKMRAAGQIQKAPISRTFFEKNKRKKKKKKNGAKTGAKSDSNLTQLKFLIGKKNSSGFDETIFLVLKRYLLVFALVSLFKNI